MISSLPGRSLLLSIKLLPSIISAGNLRLIEDAPMAYIRTKAPIVDPPNYFAGLPLRVRLSPRVFAVGKTFAKAMIVPYLLVTSTMVPGVLGHLEELLHVPVLRTVPR